MDKALYVGRFQPFHLGHLDAIKQILKKEKYLIIAIGSGQYSFEKENPFTASERYQMIEKALLEAKIPPKSYTIIPMLNVDNYDIWANYVEMILPPYKNVYSGSKIVQTLYKNQSKHPVKTVKFNKKIHSTLIRKNISENKKWSQMVPKSVYEFIKNIDGETRIREIYNTKN